MVAEEKEKYPAPGTLVEVNDDGDELHVFNAVEGESDWQDIISDYSDDTGGEYYILDAEHYVHLDRPGLIAEISRELMTVSESD